jgi:divalent metal cation (Fe/Co/Zn/Cd) transporter
MTKYHDIIHTIRDAVATAAHRVQRNPVLVGASALAAYSSLSSGHLTVDSVAAVVVGFLIRSQVVPANEVEAIKGKLEGFLQAEAAATAKLP